MNGPGIVVRQLSGLQKPNQKDTPVTRVPSEEVQALLVLNGCTAIYTGGQNFRVTRGGKTYHVHDKAFSNWVAAVQAIVVATS